MNLQRRQRLVPLIGATVGLGLLVGGCVGPRGGAAPDVSLAGADPALTQAEAEAELTRAAIVADIRARAEAAGGRPYSAADDAARTAALAARPEPRSVQEVAAIQAELLLIAELRAGALDPQEIAALEAREQELRRLFAAAQAGEVRR